MQRHNVALFLSFVLTAFFAAPATLAQGTPIGFAEDWALATDRAKVLEQLIPGTRDFYYYTCRHHQDTGSFDKVEPVLRAWVQRHGRTERVVQIENRQALLTFDDDPAETLRFLQQRLGLRFDHQRQIAGARQDLPTRLDPESISAAAFTRRALQKHPRTVAGFRESAFDALVAGDLSDDLLLSLLSRLRRPDVHNLPALIVRNLTHRRSRGFGSLPIHRQLLRDQLDECVRLRPPLLNEQTFVEVYLARLRPDEDVQWKHDAQAREEYLERLHSFGQRLASAHNSLKAHVLYHRLHHDLALGKPDKARFLAYLRLPRPAPYMNPVYLQQHRRAGGMVDANREYPTGLDRIGNDEALVRAYFMHFFRTEDSFQPYAEIVRTDYLRRLFAETKILYGIGDMERWYSLLNDPSYYERLKERVEIEFAKTQREQFGANEPVAIDVDIKNVEKLLVKIFEINTFNYYRATGREIDASINLDGLVANHEQTEEFAAGPLRRVRRRLDLAPLQKPGVYVVELIGNGLSSRAVIHKGRLRHTERIGAAGHVFRVRDSAGVHLREAAIWFGGKLYTADEAGEIAIPFSTRPGRHPLILQHGGLSSLASFQHHSEVYELAAGIHVDRESLLARRTARILIRPSLRLNGRTIGLEVLEEPMLRIRARDRDGVESSMDVRNFELHHDRETLHEIQVPTELSQLTVSLRGRIKNLSRGKTEDLSTPAKTFAVNEIDATVMTACPLLGRTASGYVLDVLGKNGEPKAGRAVRLTIAHRDYTDPYTVTCKTSASGRIELGALAGITSVAASGFPKEFGAWSLTTATRTYPTALHGVTGETLRVPYLGTEGLTTRAAVSLLEQRGGQFVRDAFEHVAIAAGFIELRDLPAGDYSLWLKEARRQIVVRITRGHRADRWALGRDRLLEIGTRARLHITEITRRGTDLHIRLDNAGKDARVHVVATRYLAPFDPFRDLSLPADPAARVVPVDHAESSYYSGREIGDEYRYILDRRFAKKYPGNMLQRPGLLLNPWALDEDARTASGLGGGAGGRWGGRRGGARRGPSDRTPVGSHAAGRRPGTFANLEFLPQPAVVVANLRADANGLVRVALGDLGSGQLVHVIAVDVEDTVYRSMARAEVPLEARSRQLAKALDIEKHFAEARRIEFLAKGGRAVVGDVATASAETYDSLAAVFRLFITLSGNADLARFAFVLRWPQLTPEEKRTFYEQHACHELHFFIYQKDPEFFAQVVRPYLANKAHKTFLDDWLLGRNVERYTEPYAFGRLNIVERILLARRLAGETGAIQRHVAELFDLKPRDPALLSRLFDSALKSGDLGEGADFKKKLGRVREELERLQSPPKKEAQPGPPTPAPGRPAADKTEAKPGQRALDDVAGEARQGAGDPAAAKAPEEAQDRDAGKAEKDATRARDRRSDLARRKSVRELYRSPDPTRPYVERNYWHRRIQEHTAGLIEVNAFWRDFALAPDDRPFVSTNIAEATTSFAEMMLALAVLDLPFEPAEHRSEVDGSRLTMEAASALLLVRKEIVPAQGAPAAASPILVSQNYYRLDEPYRYEGNQRFDAYVTEEFLIDVGYGCRVVVTNPTSAPRKLDLLLQIPEGAIPINGGFYTKGVPIALAAYATASIEYAFYFPAAGTMLHYPVHVGGDGRLVAFATPRSLAVVAESSKVDKSSWQFISQSGSEEELFEYLDRANLQRTDLTMIAWRMHDQALFAKVIERLRQRHVYADVLWSYGIRHGDAGAVREYLRHQDGFLAACGKSLESSLVTIDPIERHWYQHIEYEPLFNARAHQFGKRREILNHHFGRQYNEFLQALGARRTLDDTDWMSVTYYLLLQDRIDLALASFARVQPERLPMRVQYDYMRAYLDFFTDGTTVARTLADHYRDYPVLRWQKLFREVGSQLDEVAGRAVADGDPQNRTQRQTELAKQEPALELEVEARRVSLRYRNIDRCEVRYYEMDVEFLFSTHPFVQQGSGSFAFIKPNLAETRTLPEGKTGFSELAFDLPQRFLNSNVLIEVSSAGITRRQAYYANSIAVQWNETYGQLQVTHTKSRQPLRTVYVKVFARLPDGQVKFYKDGYTDLRGRFDYTSLSDQTAGSAQRFAILVLSEDHGAVIREVAPPTQ